LQLSFILFTFTVVNRSNSSYTYFKNLKKMMTTTYGGNPRYLHELPDGTFFGSPFESFLQLELNQLYHEKLQRYSSAFIGPDYIRLTVGGSVDEVVASIRNIVGSDYIVHGSKYGFNKNITIKVKP